MRVGMVASDLARSQGPSSAPGVALRWRGLRAVDRSLLRTQVSDLLAIGASTLTPAEALSAVCETAGSHLGLVHAVLFKRVAGQSRTLGWSASGVSAVSRIAAREQAWSKAAELFDDGFLLSGAAGQTATATVREPRLGLSAMLYVESNRVLDAQDHRLLGDLLRRLLDLPSDDD